ncbi:hypothetical protein [Methylocapsa acidiphila]|uniref:hypothetical protein n=1 Tax=Methylocapsa acidiphila TaxID=133552 RepID=UPI0004092473|nr:hypothetical protein [Methylocapsa acidiphila]
MPNPSVPEAAAIEAAYEDQVKTLYKVLVANLIDEPDSQESDQLSVDKFKVGLRIAKRARELALNALDGAAPVKITSTRKKK